MERTFDLLRHEEIELAVLVPGDFDNPYLDLEVSASFEGPGGRGVERPAFWKGGSHFGVRFLGPVAGTWRVRVEESGGAEVIDEGETSRRHLAKGLVRMSEGGRSAVWSDGSPCLLVADTAWALPFRATEEEAREYAELRQRQGFNAALLMTFQPDMLADGPEDPLGPVGFRRAFADLPEGRLTQLQPRYFKVLDELLDILAGHEILPLHTPLFYGFGWAGGRVVGPVAEAEDARRLARYLAARYGSRPGLYVVGADGTGVEPAVEAMGREFRRWLPEAPVGIHYNPWQANDAHADADWCNFHLCQTGHHGDHLPEVVAKMAVREPVRAVANGEPTYEGMQHGTTGLDAWQPAEAWSNFSAGGTFGIFYGVGSLWQWRREGEEIWDAWCVGPFDWRGGLRQSGGARFGRVGQWLRRFDTTDLAPDVRVFRGRRAVCAPGRTAVGWVPSGGTVHFGGWAEGQPWPDEVPWVSVHQTEGTVVAEGVFRRLDADPWMGTSAQLPAGVPQAILVGKPLAGA